MARAFLEDVPASQLTDSTIRQMYCLLDCGKTDEKFQKIAYRIVGRAMPGQWKDYEREIGVLYDWVKANIDYRRDPYAVEVVQDVWATLDRKRADCDDFVILLGAMVETLGAPIRIVTVSTRRDLEPNHVYLEALAGGRWIPLDATVQHAVPGWEPTEVTAKRVWTRGDVGLSGYDTNEIEGLGMTHRNGFEFLEDQSRAWRTDMAPVSQELAPGVPDDVSMTYARHADGDAFASKREFPGDPTRWLSPVADAWQNPAPGGNPYGPRLDIVSYPTPDEAWSLVPRRDVPMIDDPRRAWWGEINPWHADPDAFLPGTRVTEEDYLRNIAGLGSEVEAVAQDITERVLSGEVTLGEVEEEIDDAVSGLSGRKRKRKKRGKMLPHERIRSMHEEYGPEALFGELEDDIADRMEDALEGLGYYGGLSSLEGWLDDVAALAKGVIGAVADGVIPGSKPAVQQATGVAVDAWAAKKAGTVTIPPGGVPTTISPPAPTTGAKWGVPLAIGAGLLLLTGGMGRRRRRR